MRKLLLLFIIVNFFAPFGLAVQAETNTDNQTVDQMFTENNQSEALSEKNKPAVNAPDSEVNQGISESEPPQFDNRFGWFDFVKMFFALAVVIALIYIILRFVNKKNRLFGQMKTMENLGGISLGPNRSIQLVRIGDSVFVVGVGETIQLLKEITERDEIEKLLRSQNDIQPIDFSQSIMNKILPKNEHQKDQNSNVKSFSHLLKGQLEDLAEGRKKVYEKIKKDHQE